VSNITNYFDTINHYSKGYIWKIERNMGVHIQFFDDEKMNSHQKFWLAATSGNMLASGSMLASGAPVS